MRSLFEKIDYNLIELFAAHENAHRMGERLQRAKTELWEEYERIGRVQNLDLDQFLETSSSIIAEVYKDRQLSTFHALDQMSLVLNACKIGYEKVVKDIKKLRQQFDKRGLHCKSLSRDNWSTHTLTSFIIMIIIKAG